MRLSLSSATDVATDVPRLLHSHAACDGASFGDVRSNSGGAAANLSAEEADADEEAREPGRRDRPWAEADEEPKSATAARTSETAAAKPVNVDGRSPSLAAFQAGSCSDVVDEVSEELARMPSKRPKSGSCSDSVDAAKSSGASFRWLSQLSVGKSCLSIASCVSLFSKDRAGSVRSTAGAAAFHALATS